MAEDHVGSGRARIERMEQAGQISSEQAARLASALDLNSKFAASPAPTGQRRRIPITAVALLLVLVIVLLFLFAGGGPGEVQDVAASLNQPETVGTMNKFLSLSIAIFVLIVVPILIVAGSYNSLVNKEEAVLTAWGQVESQFQRRADLVPALVETVTQYMHYERQTLNEVTSRRQSDFGRLVAAVDEVTQGQQQFAEASGTDQPLIEDQAALDRLSAESAAVGGSIRGLLAVVEDYPDLASSDQFLELQAQLEGTENRINVARMRFNEAVGAFNSASRRIPGNLAAALGGFRRKAYFQAEEGSDQAEDKLFE